MSLKIRLARGGAKKRPFYRLVVTDVRNPRDGKFIEKLGTYNPLLANDHEDRFIIKEDRIKYWLGTGAQTTDRVTKLLAQKGLMEKPPIPKQTKQHLPKNPEETEEAADATGSEEAEAPAQEEAPAA